jgi:hypothetical protein
MAYASKAGFARTNATNPQAHAICDRCGFRYNFVDLQWQFDWRGASLQNIRILVCRDCLDTPQEQLRAIVVPADPTPIMNARVETFQEASTDYITLSAPTVYDPLTGIPIPQTITITTQDGSNATDQPYGAPAGLEPGAVMPLLGTVKYGVAVPLLSVSSNGTKTISVTCPSAHNLTTNSQISVEGLSATAANGFFSVTVTTATAFTYQTGIVVAAKSLLTSTANMITVQVGLPYGYTQIPQTGI